MSHDYSMLSAEHREQCIKRDTDNLIKNRLLRAVVIIDNLGIFPGPRASNSSDPVHEARVTAIFAVYNEIKKTEEDNTKEPTDKGEQK